MKPWMKALVWLGLGGGIGFFAGYRVGYFKDKSEIAAEYFKDKLEIADEYEKRLAEDQDRIHRSYKEELDARNKAILELRRHAAEALKAQREYLGAKDDEVISELHYVDNTVEDADESVMEEAPEMPEDPFPDYGDTDGDEEIPQLHPEDLRPYAITPDEFMRNEKGYDKIELDYYTEDCVIFDPHREEKWTHPEQLLGIGWKERFNSYGGNDIREIYVQNDTMEIVYKITRIDDSFERLYEEE